MKQSFILHDIHHDYAGFNTLVSFWNTSKHCSYAEIEVDMAKTQWFDADMCASFGAILSKLSNQINTIRLADVQEKVDNILSKNGFLAYYGKRKVADDWNTTISYKRFDNRDDHSFAEYVKNELMTRPEIPAMSLRLQKKFSECIFEIFNNAVFHSRSTQGIFCCGQYFPTRHTMNFSIADLGIGIRQNVQEIMGLNLSAEKAIRWATENRNTTKRGGIPGGLGLKLLIEFIDKNKGNIQIISDSGYWRRENNSTFTKLLPYSYPGTVVSIEINTADTQSYMLSSENSENTLF